jgi:hypothetical protein
MRQALRRHVANDGMVERFEKLAFKRAENGFMVRKGQIHALKV